MNDHNGLLLDDSTTVLRRLRIQGPEGEVHDHEGARATVPADVLRSRWDTPRGTRVRARVIRALRGFTQDTANKEPKWRKKGTELATGYRPATRS